MNDIEYFQKFKTQTVYLWEDENQCYIKSVPGKGYFQKFPGSDEKPIDSNTDTVTRAILAKKEVPKEQYEKA